ncbi:hypothetical protein PM082_019836 [Marasmius tenuissimus]|nr:hypothetical protein PM082_019836 [Marasmius tenuissimus]
MDEILAQIEDWGGYAGAAIDHGPLESPVENIKKGLKDTLKFTSGTFAHSDAYLDGPVPFLNLDGIGLVGLPLVSETQAELMVGASRVIAWSPEVMFLIPNNSTDIQVKGNPDNTSRMQSELELSTSTVPSTREERLVESLVRELERKKSVAALQSFFEPISTCLVEGCVPLEGQSLLEARCSCLRPVIETKTYPELRLDFLRSLRGIATAARDNDLVSWCKDRLESGSITRLGSGIVDYLIRRSRYQKNPSQTIRNEILVRLAPVARNDMAMFEVGFEKLSGEAQLSSSRFSKDAIAKPITDCLDMIAPELPLYTARTCSLGLPNSEVTYVVAFVNMCLRFHSEKPLRVFFMRLKDDLDNQEKLQNKFAGPTCSHLVKALRTTINAKPEPKARKWLGPFFNHAVQPMLPEHLPCASSKPELPSGEDFS